MVSTSTSVSKPGIRVTNDSQRALHLEVGDTQNAADVDQPLLGYLTVISSATDVDQTESNVINVGGARSASQTSLHSLRPSISPF
jgi:hypothetical protein